MDLTGAPSEQDQADDSAGLVTAHTIVHTATGRLVITQTQNYQVRVEGTSRHASATALSEAKVDSIFIPLAPEAQRRPAFDQASGHSAKALHGRFLRQRVVNGKTYVLTLADTDGYDPKAPTHMLMLTVDGVPALTVLPHYRKSGSKYVPTGGTYNTYDAHGKLARSTTFELSDGHIQASNGTSRLRSVADAVGSFALRTIQPRPLMAEGCLFDTGSDLLLDIVLDFAEVDVLGAIAIVNDLFGPLGCSGRLGAVVVTCKACYFVDTGDIWVCDWSGFSCDWQPTSEWYCPPC